MFSALVVAALAGLFIWIDVDFNPSKYTPKARLDGQQSTREEARDNALLFWLAVVLPTLGVFVGGTFVLMRDLVNRYTGVLILIASVLGFAVWLSTCT